MDGHKRESMFSDLLPDKVPTDFFPKRHLMDAMYRATVEYDVIAQEFAERAVHMKADEMKAKHTRMRYLNVLRRGYMRRLVLLEKPLWRRETYKEHNEHMDPKTDVWFPVHIIQTMAWIMAIMMFVGTVAQHTA